MKRICLYLAILLLLPFCLKAEAAVKWDVVGHNPTTVSLKRAVAALPIYDTAAAIRTVTTQEPENIWIRNGDYFWAMTFGPGSICRDVYVGFDSTRALRWILKNGPEPGTEIIFVLGCNNVGIRKYTPQPVVPATFVPLIPAQVVDRTSTAGTHSTSDWSIPWWWLLWPLLLLIPLFWWLWRRERNRRNDDALRHGEDLQRAQQLAATPTTAIVAPIPVTTSAHTAPTAEPAVAAATPVVAAVPTLAEMPTVEEVLATVPISAPVAALAATNAERTAQLTKRAQELADEDAAVAMMVDELEQAVAAHDAANKATKQQLKGAGYDYFVRHPKQ